MTRTNVWASCVRVALALLFFVNCNAASLTPKQQAVVVEPSAEPLQSATEQAPEEEPSLAELRPVEPHGPPTVEPPIVPPPPPPEEVHRAELRGRVETHEGKRLTIEPLMITSYTYPVPGSKAELFVESQQQDGTADWSHFAEVMVAARLHFGMSMELDIVEKEASNAAARALQKLPRGSRVRIQWAW